MSPIGYFVIYVIVLVFLTIGSIFTVNRIGKHFDDVDKIKEYLEQLPVIQDYLSKLGENKE